MNAVFSFWSKRFKETGKVHATVNNPVFLNSWILSVNLAKQFFPKVILYTDNFGFDMLVNNLGLQFDEVNLCLNDLDNIPSYLWAYGKIITYQDQKEPFIHIDYDAFLFDQLPQKFLSSDIFVESFESFANYHFYQPHLRNLFREGYSNPFVYPSDKINYAYNCGIFGGNDLDFIKFYTFQALQVADFMKDNNFHKMIYPDYLSIIFEQSALAYCLDFWKLKPNLLIDDIVGIPIIPYTHLKGSKGKPGMNEKILNKINLLFPKLNESLKVA